MNHKDPDVRPVLLTEAAENDLLRLWQHIAAHDATAADRYIHRLKIACDSIADFPDRGQGQPGLGAFARKLIVGGYAIYYDVLDDCIIVLRVFHGREDVDPFLSK